MSPHTDAVHVDIVNTLTETQKKSWEELASTSLCGSLFSSAAWSEFVTISDHASPLYTLAYHGDVLVGGLTADIMPSRVPSHYHVQRILEGQCDRLLVDIPPWNSPVELMPAMLVTNRSARLCDIRLLQDSSQEQQQAIVEKLIQAVEEDGERNQVKAISFLHVPTDAHVITSALKKRGYASACIDAQPYMPINFPDLEGYLQLFSASRRRSIRREMKAFARERPFISLQHKTLAEGLDSFLEMVDYTFQKRNFSYDPDVYRIRISNHIAVFKENAFIIEMFWKGRLVASGLMIQYKDCLYPRLIGLHPEVPKSLFPYFNLVYYCIQFAIDHKFKRMILGPGLDEMKISRGCKLELTGIYVKTDSPAVQERMQYIDDFMRKRFAAWEAHQKEALTV